MIPQSKTYIGFSEIWHCLRAVSSGWLSFRGKYIRLFEKRFIEKIMPRYCQKEYQAIAVSSGTAALHLALKALDVKEGDEVIVPNLSFVATANAILYCNATPVFVEVNDDFCINIEEVVKKITPKTKAVIAVHLFGNSCDLIQLQIICEKAKIRLIEDCCQAIGNYSVGRTGIISCYSFFANKVITTGEGGMVVTKDIDIILKVHSLMSHSTLKGGYYYHSDIGYNYRMTNMQAAIGYAQLGKIDKIIRKRLKVLGWYKKYLPEDKLNYVNLWQIPYICKDKKHIFKIIESLKSGKVDVRNFFYPLSLLPQFKYVRNKKDLFNSFRIAKFGIILPLYPGLKKWQVKYICEKIKCLTTNMNV